MKTGKRLLAHPRFSREFAALKRSVDRRGPLVRQVRRLYQNLGLVDRGCVLCGASDFTLVCESDRFGFDLQKQFCNRCGLVQTHPSLPTGFLNRFYATMYRKLYAGRKRVNYVKLAAMQIRRGEGIARFLQSEMPQIDLSGYSVFEIGCSSGGVLEGMRPFVNSVAGCDLDEEGVAWGKENLGLNLELAFIPETLPVTSPRIFVLSHVLEHLYDPLSALGDIRKLMSPSDLLYIAVPGMNMVAKGAYCGDMRRYFHIGHVTDFTMGTMKALAARSGLETISVCESVEGLFRDSGRDTLPWTRSDKDSLDNILRIEAARPRRFGIW